MRQPKPFIEFAESFLPNGCLFARLACNELPTARDGRRFSFTIQQIPEGEYAAGWFQCRSRADGDGSLRYRTYRTLEEAEEVGRKWVTRKVMEVRRKRRLAALANG